jgi:micrococcal nuclease
MRIFQRYLTTSLFSICALALAGLGCSENACGPAKGVISSITDGDTLVVETDDGESHKIRLLLVDTPETVDRTDCYGPEAKAFVQTFMWHEVKLSYESGDDCQDMYGRLLAYVTPVGEKVSINEQLIAGGYARVCRIECDESRYSRFADLEEEAQNSDQGLWNPEICPNSYQLNTWGASGCNRKCQ